MVKRKRRRGIRIERLLLVLIFFAVIIYGIYWMISSFFKPPSEIIKLNFQTIPITSNHKAVILRDETLATTQNNAVFEATVEQAQKVRNSQAVGYIKITNSENSQDLDKDKKSLDSETSYIVDESSLISEMESSYEFMLENMKYRNFLAATEAKKDLKYKLERLEKLSQQKSDNAFSLIEDSKMKVGNEKASGGQTVDVYTSKSGIVSFFIDGLEEVISYRNRHKINYEALWQDKVENVDTRGKYLSKESTLFKIIKTNVWYIAADIPKDKSSLYTIKSKLIVRDNANNEEVSATIQEVFDSGESAVLILRLTNQLPILYKDRVADITLIRDEVRGLSIPRSAVVIKNGQPGVYGFDNQSRLYHIKIDIIEDLGETLVIQEGDTTKISEDGKVDVINNINHGDEIIRNASKYREGQMIENTRKKLKQD